MPLWFHELSHWRIEPRIALKIWFALRTGAGEVFDIDGATSAHGDASDMRDVVPNAAAEAALTKQLKLNSFIIEVEARMARE